MDLICPCGSQNEYRHCCGTYHEGQSVATTPETLMRSRYTAYTMADMIYIKKTMRGKPSVGFDEAQAAAWAKSVLWLGLRIIQSYSDEKDSNIGFVEFIATYLDKKSVKTIHEVSKFHCINNQWFYVDGSHRTDNSHPAISRNAPCPCGSKRKFKNCHGQKI